MPDGRGPFILHRGRRGLLSPSRLTRGPRPAVSVSRGGLQPARVPAPPRCPCVPPGAAVRHRRGWGGRLSSVVSPGPRDAAPKPERLPELVPASCPGRPPVSSRRGGGCVFAPLPPPSRQTAGPRGPGWGVHTRVYGAGPRPRQEGAQGIGVGLGRERGGLRPPRPPGEPCLCGDFLTRDAASSRQTCTERVGDLSFHPLPWLVDKWTTSLLCGPPRRCSPGPIPSHVLS